jgi:predicted dehydrogenase
MAIEYAKVLQAQEIGFCTIGRSEKSAQNFQEKTGYKAIHGGLDKFLATRPNKATKAIVAVGVEQLAPTTLALINYGIEQILLEKPGGLNKAEIEKVATLSENKATKVFIAYNRRFYSSVLKAQQIIKEDGGVSSFNFEFTEWGHIIEGLTKAPNVKENWFLANSTHVVDLAFFIGGTPKEMSCYTSGSLSWHPSAASFAGAGSTETGVLFSYQANWAAPGRWALEVLTAHHRLYFRPMEKLQIQEVGSVAIKDVALDEHLDIKFKPGLYLQVKHFIKDHHSQLYSIQDQAKAMASYQLIIEGLA